MKFINLVAAGCVFYVPVERLDNDDPGWVSLAALYTSYGKCIPVFTSKKEYDKGPDDCEMFSLDIRTIIYYAFVIADEAAGLIINPFGSEQIFISMKNLGLILCHALTKEDAPALFS